MFTDTLHSSQRYCFEAVPRNHLEEGPRVIGCPIKSITTYISRIRCVQYQSQGKILHGEETKYRPVPRVEALC
jgi:hypothetical protein